MFRQVFIAVCLLMFISCQTSLKGYLNHDSTTEKLSGDCSEINPQVNVEATILNERYSFQKCLDSMGSYNYSATNKDDTFTIRFREISGATALYKAIIEVQTEPKYSYVNLYGNVFRVNISR